MDSQNILSKTAKGLAEASGKTAQLSRGARKLLKGIDGRTPVADLADKFTRIPEAELLKTLEELEQQGFIRKLSRAGATPPGNGAHSEAAPETTPPPGEDLDFTDVAGAPATDAEDYFAARRAAIARAKAAEAAQARAEGEAAARAEAAAEAAAKAKADAEAAAAAEAKRAEAAAMVRAYHEAQAKRVTEAKAKAEAEAAELRRRLDDELRAREELERKAKEDAERAAREAEAQARREAEELRAKLEAERAAREAEAKARAQAEERIRTEIEERARREADARARAEGEERIRRENEQRVLREAEELRVRLAAERKARESVPSPSATPPETALPAVAAPQIAPSPSEAATTPVLAPPNVPLPEVALPRVETQPAAPPADANELSDEISRRFQEEQAKRDGERQAQREEAERQRAAREAEALERTRADEEAKQARRRAEEERRRAAEEAQRRQQEEKARAQSTAEEKARAAAQAAMLARKLADEEEGLMSQPPRVAIAAALRHTEPGPHARRRSRIPAALFLLVVGVLAAAYLVRPDPASYEREATALLGTPVKIGSAYLALLPAPALRLDRVSIGPAGDVKIGSVSSRVGIGTIFGTTDAFKNLELDNVQVPVAWLQAIIWGKGAGGSTRLEHVTARGVRIEAPGLELPALSVDATLDSTGALHSLVVQSADGKQTFKLTGSDTKRTVDISARSFQLPFPGAVPLGDLTGTATLTPAELSMGKFELATFGGWARGNARVRWGSSWSVDGEFTATTMNPRLATASLVPAGRLEGKGTFSMRAPTPETLHDTARVETTFTIRNGTLGFVDLARALQPGGARGGTTSFGSLDGHATFAGRALRLTQLRLAAGLLNATGDATADAAGNLIGRLHVDVASRARGTLALGGTIAEPQVKR